MLIRFNVSHIFCIAWPSQPVVSKLMYPFTGLCIHANPFQPLANATLIMVFDDFHCCSFVLGSGSTKHCAQVSEEFRDQRRTENLVSDIGAHGVRAISWILWSMSPCRLSSSFCGILRAATDISDIGSPAAHHIVICFEPPSRGSRRRRHQQLQQQFQHQASLPTPVPPPSIECVPDRDRCEKGGDLAVGDGAHGRDGGAHGRGMLLMDEMAQGRVERNTITYSAAVSAAVSACENGGQWLRAMELMDEMAQGRAERDTTTYSAAVSACEKGGQGLWAMELMDEMAQGRVERNTVSACEKGGQWLGAMLLMEEMAQGRADGT